MKTPFSYFTRSSRFRQALLSAPMFAATCALAQVNYSGGTLTQDFNSLPSSGNTTVWIDNSSAVLPGWFAWRKNPAATPGRIDANNGSSTAANRVQSYGATGSTDRAIGLFPDASSGDMQLGIEIKNNTATTFKAFSTVCDVQLWRSSSSALQRLKCEYKINASGLTDSSGWKEIRRLSFDNSPLKLVDGQKNQGATDGRKVSVSNSTIGQAGQTPGVSKTATPGDRATVSDIIGSNFSWAPGDALWIRWTNVWDGTSGVGFGLDNFSFSASDDAIVGATTIPAGFWESAISTVRDLDHDLDAGDNNIIATRSLSLAAYICLALDYPNATDAKSKAAGYLDKCFATQLTNGDAGKFPWVIGENFLTDENAIEFTTQTLRTIYKRYASKLSSTSAALTSTSIQAHLQSAIGGLSNHNVLITYTNPYLMRAGNLAVLGEIIGDAAALQAGRDAYQNWINDVKSEGISEYSSTTYADIQYGDLLLSYNSLSDATLKAQVGTILNYFVADLSAHFFPGHNALAGAHSRDYDFLAGGGAVENFYYWAGLLTPSPTDPALPSLVTYSPGILNYLNVLEGGFDAKTSSYLNLDALSPRVVKATWGTDMGKDRYTYITDGYQIGSTSGYYGSYDKQVSADLFSGTVGFGQASLVIDKYDFPWGADYTNFGVPGFSTVLSSSGKPNHLSNDAAIVQNKNIVLGLCSLRPQFAGSAAGYWNVASNFLFPASLPSRANGQAIKYWLVTSGGVTTELDGTQNSVTSVAVGDVFGVSYGDGTLVSFVGFRFLRVDGLGGQTASLAVKFDHPTTSSLRLGRFVAYHYESDPNTANRVSFADAAPRIAWAMAAGSTGGVNPDDAAKAFLQSLQAAPATVSVDQGPSGHDIQAALTWTDGSVLEAGLNNADGAVTYRKINGANYVPWKLLVQSDSGTRRDIAAELLGAVEASVEAENFTGSTPGTGSAAGETWSAVGDTSASGGNCVQAGPNNGVNTSGSGNGPRLDFSINLPEAGTYYVWVRLNGATGNDDSVHVGLNGAIVNAGATGGVNPGTFGAWTWQNTVLMSGVSQRITVNVTAAGSNTLNLWMREDGVKVDKLILTKSAAFVPSN